MKTHHLLNNIALDRIDLLLRKKQAGIMMFAWVKFIFYNREMPLMPSEAKAKAGESNLYCDVYQLHFFSTLRSSRAVKIV